jgi:hypothetical protein
VKVKNISGGPLDVPFLDRTVGDGETVDVPDAQPDGSPLTWSAAHWEPVADKTAKADSGKAAG